MWGTTFSHLYKMLSRSQNFLRIASLHQQVIHFLLILMLQLEELLGVLQWGAKVLDFYFRWAQANLSSYWPLQGQEDIKDIKTVYPLILMEDKVVIQPLIYTHAFSPLYITNQSGTVTNLLTLNNNDSMIPMLMVLLMKTFFKSNFYWFFKLMNI